MCRVCELRYSMRDNYRPANQMMSRYVCNNGVCRKVDNEEMHEIRHAMRRDMDNIQRDEQLHNMMIQRHRDMNRVNQSYPIEIPIIHLLSDIRRVTRTAMF